MNKTILYMAISVDGFVAGKKDDISWLSPYNPFDYGFDVFFSQIGVILQGRRSYDIEVKHGWEYTPPVPIILGNGIRLFENIHKQISQSLRDLKRFDDGLVEFLYTVNK